MIFRFASAWVLVGLLPVIVAAWWMRRRRDRSDARLLLPLAAVRARAIPGGWVAAERLLPWLRAGVLTLLVVSVARPQSGARIERVSTHGVDIVVALDISGSMRAEDFRPKNRLEVARRTVGRFIEGRPDDRIGLVVFAELASTRCPLTQDHAMLAQFLEAVRFAPRDQEGTAIGMGLATAVNRLRDSTAKSRVVVLVTDGANNSGQIGPEAAAEAADALEVKIYTIGVGSEGEVPVPIDLGARGVRYVYSKVELDEDLLRQIAERTDGRYFRATDAEGLRRTFETIDELEKTEIESELRVLYSELYPFVLLPAVALLLIERLLVGGRLRRIP